MPFPDEVPCNYSCIKVILPVKEENNSISTEVSTCVINVNFDFWKFYNLGNSFSTKTVLGLEFKIQNR